MIRTEYNFCRSCEEIPYPDTPRQALFDTIERRAIRGASRMGGGTLEKVLIFVCMYALDDGCMPRAVRERLEILSKLVGWLILY
jgi:hypothetical protein